MVKVVYGKELQEFKEVKLGGRNVTIITEEGTRYILWAFKDDVNKEHSLREAHAIVLGQITKSLSSASGAVDIQEIERLVADKGLKITLTVEKEAQSGHELDVLVVIGSTAFVAKRLTETAEGITLIGRNNTLKLNIVHTVLERDKTVEILKSLLYMKRTFVRTALDIEKLLTKLEKTWGIEILCEEGVVLV